MKRMNHEQDPDSDRALEQLLSKARPRPVPPKQDEELIRHAVRDEWHRVTKQRIRNRRLTQFALAASIVAAVLITLNTLRGPFDGAAPEMLATIQKEFGAIEISGNDRRATDESRRSAIVSGHSVVTGTDSGLTLAWSDGGSLRLDQNTRVEFESRSEIYLESGRIYFDSMPTGVPSVRTDPDRAKLTIRTDAGSVRHFGTQFITQSNGDELSVLVREGSVRIEAVNVRETATVGQKLTVSRDGRASIQTVGITGGDWQWIEKTSPSFTLDNRPIIEFLNWVSRETGRPLMFASKSAEALVRKEELRGVVDMEPSTALRVYMPTTALTWHIENDVIVIGDGERDSPSGGT